MDTSKTAEASAIITEYVAFETDADKKISAQMTLGDIMRFTGEFEKAIASYREVLAAKPDHPEAMASLGLSLVADGASQTPENKEKMQEGLNFMQRYTEIAPVTATDTAQGKELKESVKATVDYLKSEKMVPQKVVTPKSSTPKKRG
jgi:lipopolysaccharide biosynthesis regulator YciM